MYVAGLALLIRGLIAVFTQQLADFFQMAHVSCLRSKNLTVSSKAGTIKYLSKYDSVVYYTGVFTAVQASIQRAYIFSQYTLLTNRSHAPARELLSHFPKKLAYLKIASLCT